MYRVILLCICLAVSATPHLGASSVPQATWNAFNNTVSGRLYNGKPMLAPCFYEYNGTFQVPGSACSAVQKNKTNGLVISNYFGGYQYVNWGSCQATGQSCALSYFSNPDYITPLSSQCYQGSVPSKYVDVQSVEDVQNTLVFAQQHNLRVTIKNTGHDYKGRSSAPDSLALWMHNYQLPLQLEKGFIPCGCSSVVGDVITMGAGQQFSGLYEFAYENNVRIVGGTSQSVGAAGGWITGGGHSILSNELGLGVDNVQQIRAVLPNGTYVTANRCQNVDIFFALRGGGGGTFGVITEISSLVYPDIPMQMAQFDIVSLQSSNVKSFISILVQNAEKWADEGFGGYFYPGMATGAYSTLLMATSNLSLSETKDSLKPLTEFATNVLGLNVGQANITTVPSIYDIVTSSVLTDANNLGAAMSSRLIPRSYFQSNASQAQLTNILYDIFQAGQTNTQIPVLPLQLNLVAPVTYSKKLPESDQPGGPGAAAITPVWREALWHVIHTREWDGTTSNPSTIQSYWQAAHDTMGPLREFTPDSGAYLNEADILEPDFETSFWGQDNYQRLLEIKTSIDPTNLLTVHQGVAWEPTDAKYSCYPNISSSS